MNADRRVVAASVFKIPIMLVYAEQVARGRLDPAERVTATQDASAWAEGRWPSC
ncbi:serine hydrolase [Nonomuraea sp. KC401]|uniref:Beta-lactamase class A catalytic domain-containing protein n=1 Tax=Nonomuraea longispora TaxID=1848320 RepID=A0A4V6P9K4_9ACTN|nr:MULTISPECIES: serine hydrolase [Nonomuraea]NBE98982.1 hypothetical protein [Nonomuraea sp. K271]TDB97405.1 hypothetical protein E1267_39900 [Nonomuraea longispora]TLF53540.1 serine hydrolase [Nonomuraea sp. KC401]